MRTRWWCAHERWAVDCLDEVEVAVKAPLAKLSHLCLLTDGMSDVPGFEAQGAAFHKWAAEQGLQLLTCAEAKQRLNAGQTGNMLIIDLQKGFAGLCPVHDGT